MVRFARRLPLFIALALLPLTSGCLEDETTIGVPDDVEGELFLRYVALGNSITAGFQSGGINANTQQQAYPVFLAEKANASFDIPALALPGCPPPLLGPAPLTDERLGGDAAPPCALRETPAPDLVQNLAVPGATLNDALENASANPLSTFILGGRTQTEAVIAAEPTLVSVWIGNNDALAAALSGDLSQLTPLESFTADYEELAIRVARAGARETILVGVVDPGIAPLLQPGAYFFAAAQQGLLDKPVNQNCAPFTATGQPNPLAANSVSFLAASNPDLPEISCANDAPFVLNRMERDTITARVSNYNAVIQSEVANRDWVFVDPNVVISQQFFQAGTEGAPDLIRKCQGLASADSPAEFQTAVEETCPGPSAPNFFGSLISFDGTHPSAEGHAVFADALAFALNSEVEGLDLPLGGN